MSTVTTTPPLFSKEELARILAELRRGLEGIYGPRLKGLYLFGSYARGDAEPGSDIDVAVVLEDEVDTYCEIERTGDVVSALSLQNETVLSLAFMSDDHCLNGKSAFLMNFRTEAQPIVQS